MESEDECQALLRDRLPCASGADIKSSSCRCWGLPGPAPSVNDACIPLLDEGLVVRGDEGNDAGGLAGVSAWTDAAPAYTKEATDEVRHGRNDWIYHASMAPGTLAERSALREAITSRPFAGPGRSRRRWAGW